ncbi:MAG: ferrous iron transport protein B [Chloroflexi bacterium]|jgi:ferrous iron transport protein B|nr:ferrous iron transport protein B [Chloroflexota bacterium]
MSLLERTEVRGFTIDYGPDLEEEIEKLGQEIARYPRISHSFPKRWLAIKLLEQDREIQQRLLKVEGGAAVLTHAQIGYAHLAELYGEDIDATMANRRYGWIHSLVGHSLHKTKADDFTTSDKIDAVLTHKYLGIPIFLAAMWAVFKLTAEVSAPYIDWIDNVLSGPVTNWILSLLSIIGLGSTWIASLFVDGVIAGVGGLLVFIPVLMFLYLALAVLEDSGYMARAAFVMDSLMSRIGLHGKSFLPLMVGFGCSVPAIYATRTLENEKDRILTGLLVPFMSCGARLPVYVMFAAIFFPQYGGAVVFGLYLLGIITAIILGIMLRRTVFQDEDQSAFVMELPPYRMPALRSVWFHMWHRTRSFLKSAWTMILGISIVIWLLMAIPVGGGGDFADTEVDSSLYATMSGFIAPALEPLGFGNWQSSGALLSGFVAKEVVVSTLAQVYGAAEVEEATPNTTFLEDVGEIVGGFVQATADTIKSIPLIVGINLFNEESEAEPSTLMLAIENGFEESSGGYGALAALSFMVFVLIYTPCMVAASAEKQELGARWMWVSLIGQLLLAWGMAFLIFRGGKLLMSVI